MALSEFAVLVAMQVKMHSNSRTRAEPIQKSGEVRRAEMELGGNGRRAERMAEAIGNVSVCGQRSGRGEATRAGRETGGFLRRRGLTGPHVRSGAARDWSESGLGNWTTNDLHDLSIRRDLSPLYLYLFDNGSNTVRQPTAQWM